MANDSVDMPLRAFKDENMSIEHIRVLATVLRSNPHYKHPPVKTLAAKTGLPVEQVERLLADLLLWDYIAMET